MPAAVAFADPSFEFSDADFHRVRELIFKHAGISLTDSKQHMVYSRLGRRLRALGMDRFSDYLTRLESGDKAELQAFTNALTTNLTAFFREEHHFPILADYVGGLARSRAVTLWCAAASTGEEPYSMAITLAEQFGSMRPPVRVIATDIDTNVIATATRGVYAESAVEKISPALLQKYFLRGKGDNAGFYRIRPELQEWVIFRRLNLLDLAWSVRGPLDAVFCRNVMIYFDVPTQRRLLERFVQLLRPDSLLFAGHSESLSHSADLFKLQGKSVYQVVAGGAKHDERK
jgi:chemotaxis protein methyltransferase CheR